MKRIPVALGLILIPGMALAHPGHGIGFGEGLLHPLSGADHLLAMTGVGLWAASLGGRARWALPMTFLAAMLVGAMVALATSVGLFAAGVEPMILASVILLSAAVALSLRAPLALALPLVAVFGAAHGAAHGMEGSGLGFGAGFLIATAALHGAGLGLGLLASPGLRRALGGAGLVVGLALAVAG